MEKFLIDINNSQLNEKITACEEFEEAAEIFEAVFRTILDKHAPVKKFQVRKNYLPFISEDTKLLFNERKAIREESTKSGNAVLEI